VNLTFRFLPPHAPLHTFFLSASSRLLPVHDAFVSFASSLFSLSLSLPLLFHDFFFFLSTYLLFSPLLTHTCLLVLEAGEGCEESRRRRDTDGFDLDEGEKEGVKSVVKSGTYVWVSKNALASVGELRCV